MQIPLISNLFHQTRQQAGGFAICIHTNGVYLSRVKRGGAMPQVLSCTFHAVDEVTPAVLEKLRRDEHIGDFQFITLLAPGEYQMQLVEAPNVPVDELKSAIRWRIKDSLNYHIDDATVDVLQIPSGKNAGERPQSLYAIAAPNTAIRKRIELFEKARIDLKVIDIPELAQRNIAELFEVNGQGLALLAFDESGGMLSFTAGGELYLARRIEISLGQLQDADESLRGQALDRLELEVQRSMDFFSRQFHQVSVNRLLISAPDEAGLVEHLSRDLDWPVEKLDLSQVLDLSAVPELADSGYAAHAFYALGAALRNEKRVL
jgi:MSHA biogenesis protein MshI